jgi:hypothetical protein
MERYTAARRRNALIQAGVNGGAGVFNVATGKVILLPLMAAISLSMVRTWRTLGTDPAAHQADWHKIRDALTETDVARAAGEYRRLPSPRAIAVFAAIGLVLPLQAKLFTEVSLAVLLAAGVVMAALLVVADVYLHYRHAPAGGPLPGLASVAARADVVLDLRDDLVDTEWDGEFPIVGYDDLTVAQILPLLPSLHADELRLVAAREASGKARRTVLQRVARLETVRVDTPAVRGSVSPAL